MGVLWNPNAQCPNRGPGLSHVRDREARSDGSCAFCGEGPKFNICRSWGCVESTGGTYCEKCTAVRAHTAYSHKVEGHRDKIVNCPPCEENRFR